MFDISFSDALPDDISPSYPLPHLNAVLHTTLDYMQAQIQNGIVLPYFSELPAQSWLSKPKGAELFVTDTPHGQALNLAARHKDYPTNILSYPSQLPIGVLSQLPILPLGELVLCHAVLVDQAKAQHKSFAAHRDHLVVHGLLHLLGFDHERGEFEQTQMEGFETVILQQLGVTNPYLPISD